MWLQITANIIHETAFYGFKIYVPYNSLYKYLYFAEKYVAYFFTMVVKMQ